MLRAARWQQLTNTSSGTTRMLPDLVRAEERAVGQHDAARVAASAAGRPPLAPADPRRLAVAGDVDDAPVALEQRVDDGARVGADCVGSSGLISAVTRSAPSAARQPQRARPRAPRRARRAGGGYVVASHSARR